jgi:hypothetical protein
VAALVYWVVVAVLAAAMLFCLSLTFGRGFDAVAVGGLVGALVFCAVLLSYLRSMRTRRHPPVDR